MVGDNGGTIQAIKTFPQLVKYLRDELDWPVETDDFEELTFDYEPEELGIDAATAAKVQEIKQLRPLVTGQPWGIFFVKFEPKRLPVVALRRILNRLVVKKRASSRKAERAAWELDDLLFISNYGESDTRQITFAHFTQDEEHGGLPTLRVLGWDDADTVLHIDHVHQVLRENLRWPKNVEDTEEWRQRWSSVFTIRHKEVITTSKALSERLAQLAIEIRKRVNTILQLETDRGPLRKLHAAFKAALIHDLTEDDFADIYAQTITYGLLTARVSHPEGLEAGDITDMLPVTNPFLRDLLGTFMTVGGRKGKIDFDEVGVNDVVETLRDANMEAVLRDFGDRKPEEDPVIFFYEDFLKAYDAEKKVKRGVFYTPKPVVSYIVRSVHELLQTEFGLEDGLADTATWGDVLKKNKGLETPGGVKPAEAFVQILDPATGTGTFLVEVIDVIYKTLSAKWKKQKLSSSRQKDAWNDYVEKHLLPRLYGYEIMMAPYAIAHMKIGLKLHETGYSFGSNERARIYLTNTLEPPTDTSQLSFFSEALAREAEEVNALKLHRLFTVVIGNPPYSGLSANLTEQARGLVSRFKFIDGVKLNERGALQLEKNLQDDYIKFLAFAEDRLHTSHAGICGLICNHGFIDNPTLRGVRWSLLSNFDHIWVLDLHGNVNRGEKAPDGSDDQNVFDIKDAGVAILIATRSGTNGTVNNSIQKKDIWGDRDKYKYPFLLKETVNRHPWDNVQSSPDLFLFRMLPVGNASEYADWLKVTEIFPLHSIGIITARDSYVIDFEPDPIIQRAKAFRDSRLGDEETCTALGIPIKKGWNISRARARIKQVKDLRGCIQPLLYRPFDVRPVFYHESLIWGMAWPVMQQILGGRNLALITSRMTKGEDFQHVLVSKNISEVILLSSKTSNNAFVFPLHVRTSDSELDLGDSINFSPEFIARLRKALCSTEIESNGLPKGISPEDVLRYTYSVFHSHGYRNRYAEFLKIDFPRLPLTNNLEFFKALADYGEDLIALHLMESPKLEYHVTEWLGDIPSCEIEKVTYSDSTIWIDKNQSEGFKGVTDQVWTFHIGGYQVCEKWLKDRGPKKGNPGRTLSAEDIEHYQRIVVAINETIRLMEEVDEVIESYGGWPGAFMLLSS